MTTADSAASSDDQLIYRGTGMPHDGIDRLPPPPPWRRFGTRPPQYEARIARETDAGVQRAVTYQTNSEIIQAVNAALVLRRPLLVTGSPGTGKSSLAYSVAHELDLGPVLRWPITRTATVQDGLYSYDAIARFQDTTNADSHQSVVSTARPRVGSYVRLGPLGTALLATSRPRVLLIDDLDESDIDLPNDLLNVFETGEFEIPELVRYSGRTRHSKVLTFDRTEVDIDGGVVQCTEFPLVIITSNGERDFPPRFLRRCLRLALTPPSRDVVSAIVSAHLGDEGTARSEAVVDRFLYAREEGHLAVDQLLNAVFLAASLDHEAAVRGGGPLDDLLRPLEADDLR